MSFCLYIAARVFVQYMKSRPDDSTVFSSLQFVVSALNAMKTKNPLTESFLVQLDVDIEGTGIRAIDPTKSNSVYVTQAMVGLPEHFLFHMPHKLTSSQQANCPDNIECTSLYTLRETQSRNSAEDPSASTNSTSSNPQPQSGIATSLPTRHRDSRPVYADSAPSDNIQHYFPHAMQPPGSSSGAINQGAVVEMDMDFSPDLGMGERNPPSDHPTPSTLNSSSNTSYSISGADYPSPGKKQQYPGSAHLTQGSTASFDPTRPVQTTPPKTTSPQGLELGSMATQAFPASTSSPLRTPGAAAAFSMPTGWNVPTPNTELNNMNFDNASVDALTEAQWAQILNNNTNGAGWENWRPS